MNYIPKDIPHVRKKIGNVRIVWFENSRSFVMMDKLSYSIFRLLLQKNDNETIVDYCKKRFPGINVDIPQFVHEIIDAIQKLSLPQIADFSKIVEPIPCYVSNSHQTESHYLLGENCITIRYDSKYLKDLVHPLFFHLETEEKQKVDGVVELTGNDKMLQLIYNDHVVDSFKPDEINYFKGAILKLLYGLIHNKTETDWMMTLHSSGIIVGNNEAILFIAGPGSGKSTLAALLHAHGYPLLSDDFVAADRQAFVYPFPAAVSVKEGSVDLLSGLYPGLLKNRITKAANQKMVRFIKYPNKDILPGLGYKIKTVVFLNYSARSKTFCRLLSKKDAIGLLLREIWVNPEAKNINRFFQWVTCTPFYQMNYSSLEEALGYISKITEN